MIIPDYTQLYPIYPNMPNYTQLYPIILNCIYDTNLLYLIMFSFAQLPPLQYDRTLWVVSQTFDKTNKKDALKSIVGCPAQLA